MRGICRRFIEQWTQDSGPDDRAVSTQSGTSATRCGAWEDTRKHSNSTRSNLGRARRILGIDDPVTISIQTSVAADQRARGNFTGALTSTRKRLTLSGKNWDEATRRPSGQ